MEKNKSHNLVVNIIIICLLGGIYTEFKNSNNINKTSEVSNTNEVVEQAESNTNTNTNTTSNTTTQPVQSQEVKIPKVTYETRNNEELQGKEAYAIGMLNHHYYNDLQNSLLFNVDIDSVFSLNIAEYDGDVSNRDIVKVQGIFNMKDGVGNFSNATITKASTSQAEAFLQERDELKDSDWVVYDAEALRDVDYETLLRGGHDIIGTDLIFKGTVKQIIYDTSTVGSIVNTISNKGTLCNIIIESNYNKDELIVGVYYLPNDEARLLEGDEIVMYGTFSGVNQFEMVLSAPKSYPCIDVKFIVSPEDYNENYSSNYYPRTSGMLSDLSYNNTYSNESNNTYQEPIYYDTYDEPDYNTYDLIYESLSNYFINLVASINSGDFGYVENYMVKDSSLYNSQKSLVNRLYGNGTTESFEKFEILFIEYMDSHDDIIEVDVLEVISIYYADGTSKVDAEFNYTYSLKYSNGRLLPYDIK